MDSLREELYSTEDDQAFAKLFERIQKGEEGSDRMENEIGRYLGDVGDAHLSDETKLKIRAMLRQIGELESVGDGCFNLARIIRRKREHKIDFTPRMEEGIQSIFSLVEYSFLLLFEPELLYVIAEVFRAVQTDDEGQ